MRDKHEEHVFEDVFNGAVRTEDWAHLAGGAADARAKSVRLRRTRYAGIAGATTAVAVVAAVVAGSLGVGDANDRAASPASSGTPPKIASPTRAVAPSPSVSRSQAPAKGTMGALFAQWKSCPDSELTAVNTLPQDPSNLQQRWRDACHRDVATLSALLPGYDVTPAVSGIGMPARSENAKTSQLIDPTKFDDPDFVVPPGYTPQMGPSLYRIADKDGGSSEVVIRAYGHDDQTKPVNAQPVTLPNGLQGVLALNDNPAHGQIGYEIYILDKGKTFYMFLMPTKTGKPNFDFKALVMTPQFADMAAKALAAPES